jgi:hypothetical protein
MNNIQQTSIASYKEVKQDGSELHQKEQVFNAFRVLDKASDRMVSIHTGIPVQLVSARRNALGNDIAYSHTSKCATTGKNVRFYKVNPFPEMSFKKLSNTEKLEKLKSLAEKHIFVDADEILEIINK